MRKLYIARTCICFLLVLLIPLKVIASSYRFVTTEWEGYTEASGEGLYFDVLKAAFEPLNINYTFSLVPWKRAELEFEEGKAIGIIGAYLDTPPGIYPKWAIDVDVVSMLYKKGSFKWTGKGSLKDQNVAWIRGYGFEEVLDINPKKLREVNDTISGIKMLQYGRINVYIDYQEEIITAAKEKNLKLDEDFTLEYLPINTRVYIAFADNKEGMELAKLFDKRMSEMKQSGELDQIYIKTGDMKFLQDSARLHSDFDK